MSHAHLSLSLAFSFSLCNSLFSISPENAVHDFGDLNFEHLEEDDRFMNVPFPRTVGRANQMLSDAMSRAVGAGHTAVMLGGDHRYHLYQPMITTNLTGI